MNHPKFKEQGETLADRIVGFSNLIKPLSDEELKAKIAQIISGELSNAYIVGYATAKSKIKEAINAI